MASYRHLRSSIPVLRLSSFLHQEDAAALSPVLGYPLKSVMTCSFRGYFDRHIGQSNRVIGQARGSRGRQAVNRVIYWSVVPVRRWSSPNGVAFSTTAAACDGAPGVGCGVTRLAVRCTVAAWRQNR